MGGARGLLGPRDSLVVETPGRLAVWLPADQMEQMAADVSSALTRSGGRAARADWSRMSFPQVITAVGRRVGPQLLEAVLVPALLFYVALVTWGVLVAYLVTLSWSYGLLALRKLTRRSVSALHALMSVALTARTLLALVSGSTLVYFAQPVVAALVLAAVFFVSIVLGSPLVARIAHQFCPFDTEAAHRPAVVTLFRRLTHLWGVAILLKGAATLVLMLTLPVSLFVLIRTMATLGLTAVAIALTFALSYRTARAEQLVAVNVTNGPQRFVVTSAANVMRVH